MEKIILTEKELMEIRPGEALTIGAILAIMAIAIAAVAAYKLFTSSEASIKFPGGFTFKWA